MNKRDIIQLGKFVRLSKEVETVKKSLETQLEELDVRIAEDIRHRNALREALGVQAPTTEERVAKAVASTKKAAKKAAAKKTTKKTTAKKPATNGNGTPDPQVEAVFKFIEENPSSPRAAVKSRFSNLTSGDLDRVFDKLRKTKRIENRGTRRTPAYYAL